MSVEADASGVVAFHCRWLAQIVEECCQDQRHGSLFGQERKHEPRMDEDVAFWMKIRRLFAAFQRKDFRQDLLHQSTRIEQIKSAQPLR